MEVAQKGRWAVTTLFSVNGFVTGAWAVQIAQLVSRFHITDKVIGHLILIFGLGALFMMPMSGMATYTPGMEISGGSLGLGLGIAVGMCLGLKRKASKSLPSVAMEAVASTGTNGEGIAPARAYGV